MPSANDLIQPLGGVTQKHLVPAEGQFINEIGIDLMPQIKVGAATAQARIERVGKLRPTNTRSTGGRGSVVDRVRPGVVESNESPLRKPRRKETVSAL